MKTLGFLSCVLLTAFALRAGAQQDISGTWAGDLAVGPDTTIPIHFVLTLGPDGRYTTVVTSPNPDGIQDVAATSTSFEGNRLVLTVDELSGRYEGTLANGAFDGEWQQEGTSIPLDLAPYVPPVLTDAAKDLLRGSWVGKLELPGGGGELAIVFRFEDNSDGEFVGFLDSPDQGANGIPVANIVFQDGDLGFRIPRIRGEYSGTVSGDSISGSFSQGQTMPLNLARGEYEREGIELSQAAKDRLEGSWVGKLQGPGGGINVVFRFETNADGNFEAFLDSPDQGASGIPVTELAYEDGQLSLSVAAVRGNYTATVTDSQIEGTWKQGPGEQTLTLTRGEYTPAAAGLGLSDAAIDRLTGAWRGQMGPIEIIIRFETTSDGAAVAFLDVPAQGASGLPIPAASLDGDALSVSIPAIGASYTATLDASTLSGEWRQGPATNALTLTRQ